MKKMKLLIILSVFLISSNSCKKISEATAEPTTPTISLSDGFSGISSVNWIIISGAGTASPSSVTSGDPDVIGSPQHGNPSPGLWMKGASYGTAPGGGGGIQSVNTYPDNKGLTVSVDARFDSGYDVGSSTNGMVFSLTDISNGPPRAWINIFENKVTYYLTMGTQQQIVSHTFPYDASFHNFKFTVNASGNAEWRRDGALQQTVTGFPSNLNLYLKTTSPGSSDTALGSAHIDNVLVTTP